jgi:hypothetical protein
MPTFAASAPYDVVFPTGMRRNARHQVPDWVYRGQPDPDCGFDPDCSVIRAGGGGSFKKR